MAYSGSRTFNLSIEEIIEEASVYNFKNIFCFGDKINV